MPLDYELLNVVGSKLTRTERQKCGEMSAWLRGARAMDKTRDPSGELLELADALQVLSSPIVTKQGA